MKIIDIFELNPKALKYKSPQQEGLTLAQIATAIKL